VAGEVGGRRGLGLGQVVALGIVGQGDLDHVEQRDVRLVALGPRHPHPHDRTGGQIHHRGVLERRGQDEEMQGRPP
jgi:hypothetical protein